MYTERKISVGKPKITQPESALRAATPKAVEYRQVLEQELARPKIASARRTEIEEDLARLDKAKFVELNGVVHHYVEEGPTNGEPIIFVHGWDCSSLWWHSSTKALAAKGYRTIAYDLRGHGFSGDPINGNDDYSVDTMVADLEALAQHLELPKFHLAAFSIGALVATAYAARHSDKVASLAFFNYGLFQYNPNFERVGPRLLSTVFSKGLSRIKSWRFVYYYVRLTLTKNPVAKRDILYGLLSLHDTSARATYYNARSAFSRKILDQLPGWAKSLQMPVLLVAGSDDRVISRKSAEKLAQLLPNVVYFVMPHCGHLILGELPEQVNELLYLHLSRTVTPENSAQAAYRQLEQEMN